MTPGTVRMCFADPPCDVGKDYGRGPADDRKAVEGYAEFTRRWVSLVAPLLTPGRLLVHAVRDARDFVFHADAVAVPSERQTMYSDPRADPSGRTPSG